MLAVLAAPAAVAAACALEFRDGLERLALHVESLVQEALGVFGNNGRKRSVFGASLFQNDIPALLDLSGGNSLKTDGADAFSF